VVHAEEIDLLDQIRLFSNAKLIIGAHGAGLIHAIWAKDCALFEIVDDQPINRCFEWQTLVQKNVYRRFKVAKEPNYPLLVSEIYDAIQHL
jgi:capsular polysaccharide biosynthesis protein